MDRRAFVTGLAVILTAQRGAEAQQMKAPPRIGFLAGGSRASDSLLIEAFWRRMNGLGYHEGKNVTAEYGFAEGAVEQLPELAAELVRLDVDLIVGPGSGARAAKQVTSTIPIVIAYGDPVGSGLIASFAHPGGNVTGQS
jgi:putative ABC transport system substrate-binding protein